MGAVGRFVKGLLGVTALVVLIGLVPLFLLRSVGNPWPGRSSIELRDEPALLLGALAAAAWVVWARFVLAVGHEVVVQWAMLRAERAANATRRSDQLRPVSAPPRPPAGSLGALAQRLVALALLLIPLGNVASPASAALPLRPVAAASATVSTPSTTTVHRPTATDDRTLPEVAVQANDSLFRIAERHLGDRARWREVLELNIGRVQPDGARLTTPSSLRTGWTLALPADATNVMARPASPMTPPADQEALGEQDPAEPLDSHVRTHVVEAGDSYWSIAAGELELSLGRSVDDSEVLDATLSLIDTNAPLFAYDDPAMLHPGDEVVLPPSVWPPPALPELTPAPEVAPEATPPPEAAPDPEIVADEASPTAEADPAEEPSTPVADRAEVTPPLATTPQTAAPAADPSTRAADPESPAAPGQGGALGPARGEAIPAQRPPTTTTEPGLADLIGQGDESSSRTALPLGLGSAVLVAGGALAVVDARRRAALRRASAHARLAAGAPDATAVSFRALGAADRLLRLDLALRALAVVLRDRHVQPTVVVVHGDGTVAALLSGPAAPVAPWIGSDDGWWSLPGATDVGDLAVTARGSGLPCPTIVHLGTSEGADLYLDVEAVGVLGVDGPDGSAGAIVDALALGLAVSPFAAGAAFAVVGVDEGIDEARPGLERCADGDAALAMVRATLGTIAAATSMGATTFELRARSTIERWEPAVVLLGRDVSLPADLSVLAGSGGRGVAVVSANPAASGATLRHDGALWVLDPWGIPVEPVGVSPGEIAQVVRLLEGAERDQLVPAPFDQDIEPIALGPGGFEEREWELMVRVLGGVRVHDGAGVDAQFERGKAQELVCWLALHRATATRAGARTALWETDVRDATFANVVSDARRTMARLVAPPDGEEWVGRTLSESLPLHPFVVTDADLLADRVAAARGQAPEVAVALLRPGLALVNDLPFSGTGYLWPDVEGTVTELILLATTAAVEMGHHCLQSGDVEGVFWATGQGLSVLPGHEELVALRMRAHAREGDLAAVRAEWGSYERALAADPWSDAEPASKLVALRRDLLGPSAAKAPV